MKSGDSFSHACPSRVPTGRWTLPSRAIQKRVMRAPTRVHIQSRDAGGDCKKSGWTFVGSGLGCFSLNRPDWNTEQTRLAQVGSDVATEAPDGILRQGFGSEFTTVDPDGILMQGQRLPTPNSPPEVMVVVVWRKESRIDPICKKTAQTVRNVNPTGQSGCFFVLG
ncbi:hypothetical protein CRG98_005807 [Punica granatum]|uniref:Uncharacterized protein n=1 Tax=Punica granatum TaxID=22663 RepID=A0A2I0KZR0_PUNGR|nr:hypothetical protein CRG98_005807 [Punica granatum]